MTRKPLSFSISLALILINALIWLVLGLIIGTGAHPAMNVDVTLRMAMAALALFTSAVLVVLFFSLRQHIKLAYFFCLALLLLLSLITLFDDFGWTDLIVLLITLAPVALLLKDRAWFMARAI